MNCLTLRPRTEPVTAWQFTGQPETEWPAWVRRCCRPVAIDGAAAARHERQSGAQILYPGEWLVRDLDGAITFYTGREVEAHFHFAFRP